MPLPRRQIRFISTLRVVAAWFVVWDHLAAQWPDRHSTSWPPLRMVRRYVSGPLHINQDFGWLGVCLFFLISGFIITHASQDETRTGFAVKRFFRIVPAYFVTIGLVVLLAATSVTLGLAPTNTHYSFVTVLENLTLTNFLFTNSAVVLSVAWTLIIEILFYALTWLMLPWVKRRPTLVLACNLTIVGTAVIGNWSFGPSWIRLMVNLSYLSILTIGQAIYYKWTSKIGLSTMVFACLVAIGEFVEATRAIPQQYYQGTSAFCVSLAYAIVIFALALHFTESLGDSRIVLMLANMSYSTYLLHGVLGAAVLDIVVVRWHSMALGFALAVAVSIVASWLLYQFVERPGQRLARRIVGRRRARGGTVVGSLSREAQ